MAQRATTGGAWTVVAIIAGVLPCGLATAAGIGFFYGQHVRIEKEFLGGIFIFLGEI